MSRIKRQALLSSRDLAFLEFALDDHLNLLHSGRSCTWSPNIHQEKNLTQEVISHLRSPKAQQTPLTNEQFWFVELAMAEHCDFACEGMTPRWYKTMAAEGANTSRLLEKLSKYFTNGCVRSLADVQPDTDDDCNAVAEHAPEPLWQFFDGAQLALDFDALLRQANP